MKALEVFRRNTNEYSANILICAMKNCWTEFLKVLQFVMQKYWEMISKKYCKVLSKTTGACSETLKGALKTCWEVFCKSTVNFLQSTVNTEMCSAKILVSSLQKYWDMFCKNRGKRCSAKVLKGILQRCSKLCYIMNNFLVKTQGLGLFPLWSRPCILTGQKLISNYWEESH